jgi:hypothetical protein
MRRPVGVTLIGCLYLASGAYLCSLASIHLLAPAAVPALPRAPLIYVLKFANPYVTLAVGAAWALVAWGLFRLRDWARLTAMVVLGTGAAWELSLLLFGHYSVRPVVSGLEVALRLVAALYLLSPSIIDAFNANHSRSV